MRAGKTNEAVRITRGKGAKHVIRIENAMNALTAFAQKKADEFVAGANAASDQSIRTLYLLLSFLVLAMTLFSLYLTRSITRPLEALRAATLEIGKGKFDVPLNIEAGGELGELAISVREMTNNLKKVTASRDALNREIVERKKAEKTQRELMATLEEKAAEMERFVYTVSHDLKSPLITIQGFLGLLEKDAMAGETSRLHGDVGQIQKAARQMQELLADLLEISRIGRLVNPPEKVSFNELAQEAANLLAGQIKKCGARVDIAPDLPVLFGDRKRLLEVIQNLIDNADKYLGRKRPSFQNKPNCFAWPSLPSRTTNCF